MSLDLDAINELSAEIAKSTKGGNSYLKQKDLDEEMDYRIIPPRPNMKGVIIVTEKAIWLNNKKYVSSESIGETCVMQEIINEALAKNDPDLTALVKRMCYQGDLDKLVNVSYNIPLLKMTEDRNGNILDVPESGALTLQCTTMLVQRILKLVSHRNYRGEKDGEDYTITHPKFGHNITLSKKKNGSRTEYDAIAGKQVEIAESFYDPSKLPNPVYNLRKQMKSDAYLKSVINNYLYGTEKIDEEDRYSEKELEGFKITAKDEEADKPKAKAKTKPKAEPSIKKTEVKEDAKGIEEAVIVEEEVEKKPANSGKTIEEEIGDLD